MLGLPVLALSPVLAVLAGMVFVVKAGMLSGSFYFSAAACFAGGSGLSEKVRLSRAVARPAGLQNRT